MSYRKKYLARLGGICLSLTFIFLTGCINTSPTSSSPATKGPTQTHISQPTMTPVVSLGAAGCKPPSPIQPAAGIGIPEVQGTATTGTELWALLFNPVPIPAREDVKIVWKMTGSGDFHLVVQGPHGIRIRPLFGPEVHGGSNWQRPGAEWGTGYNFPVTGCWDFHATRDSGSGDVWLLVEG
jgi:hypothetical protein